MRRFHLLSILAILSFASCTQDDAPNPPVNNSGDSISVATRVFGYIDNGLPMSFTYTGNKLTKIKKDVMYGEDAPVYVYYKADGKVDYLVAHYKDINGAIQKASMVFEYNNIGKVGRVFYKQPQTGLADSDPYFTDLSDNFLVNNHDSLVYASGNVQRVFQVWEDNFTGTGGISSYTEFFYNNSSDTSIYKIEVYNTLGTGSLHLYDQLLITQSSFENPVYKDLWYFPFIFTLTYNVGSGGNVMWLPLIFDDPSTNVDLWLPMIPRMISHYEVNNDWGLYNYHNTYYNYHYSAQQDTLYGVKNGGFFENVAYVLKRVPR